MANILYKGKFEGIIDGYWVQPPVPEPGVLLWTPELISPALWLDSGTSESLTLVTSRVSEWIDLSGNNRNATQSISSLRPTYVSPEPGLSFNGGNRLGHPVINANPSELSIFAVASGSGIIWAHRSDITNLIQLNKQTDTELRLQLRSSATVLETITATTSSGIDLLCGIFSRSTNSHNAFVNGVGATANTTNFSGNFDASLNTIGATNNGSYFTYLTGSIQELIVYNFLLTTEERQKNEGYLAHKWGLESKLNSAHPYKTNPPLAD
jgi:hypothetical protein